jgi:hypothetical protein
LAFVPDANRWPILSTLYQPLIFTLRSSRYIRSTVAALWLAHALEAGFAASLCGSAGLPGRQVAGWSLLTLVMGFGVLPGLREGLRRAEERHARDKRRALRTAAPARAPFGRRPGGEG